MKIEHLHSESTGDLSRIAATVVWEDCDRPSEQIYFETSSQFAQDLTCNPHSFLLAGIIPALHHGERRIAIDAEICPELRIGLTTAMEWIRHWYQLSHAPVQIESKVSSGIVTSSMPERAGWFFSGGIDSLATLRANRLNFPSDHPASIKDGLTVYGISSGGDEVKTSGQYLEAFDRLVSSISTIAEDAEINLIPVYTNVRQLDPDSYFWSDAFQGAVLASVAHAFARRLTTVSIASGSHLHALRPHGSHPDLDPNYSSHNLRIKHDGITLSRLAKTELIANWDVALKNLKVCTKVQRIKSNTLNCGRCEKCMRTMSALLALDKLDQTSVFPSTDISEEQLVNTVYPKSAYQLFCYQELIPLFAAKGRLDLVRGVERIAARYHETDLKGGIKKLIRRYMGNTTRRFKPLPAALPQPTSLF